ncbi:hypothetical protein PIB30_064645 [Stylosanthes scabra]|uniref:BHLH domain-containing protein n=1 Tax=Stylosanthes scabra TaxID=79078 RepID=A0ABU6YNN0_9FABA|nr:hypothetical protein [Stylosanthes scabra]
MESPTTPSWFYDLQEMEDDYNNFFPKENNNMNNLLDDYDEDYLLTHDIEDSIMFESLSNNNNPSIDDGDERPSKLLKTSTNNSNSNNSASLSPKFSSISSSSSTTSSFQSHILCFDNSNSSPNNNHNNNDDATHQLYDLDYATMNTKTKKNGVVSGSSKNKNLVTKPSSHGSSKKSPSHAQDHIIAERKRREKISQSFIALAALVPGLKKMDKATVLDNAINYVKDLKARLATLEQEKKTKQVEEPCVVVLSKRSSKHDDDESSENDDENNNESVVIDNDNDNDSCSLLHHHHVHVEARVSGQQVLLRIHCHNHKGILVKLLSEIQGLNLLVLNSSVLPFGDSLLDITVITQMGEGYNLTLKELVKSIRVETLKFISCH